MMRLASGLLALSHPVYGMFFQSLNGADWQVRNANGSISTAAKVPGTVHVALQAADVIGDPYYRFHELEYQWVALDNWTFSKKFTADEALLKQRQIVVLEFESIDTIGEVVLNSKVLGNVADMHARVGFHLQEGQLLSGDGANCLEVRLLSPLSIARSRAAVYGYPVPITHFYNNWDDNESTGAFSGNESSSRNFVRKTSSDFGWDWGPSFIPQGIPGDVSLRSFVIRVDPDFIVRQQHNNDGSVTLNLSLSIISAASRADGGRIQVVVKSPEDAHVANADMHLGQIPAGKSSYTFNLRIDAEHVQLWWPVGYGDPALHTVTISYDEGLAAESKVGLRTVRLVTDPVPANRYNKTGETFYFEVNGVPIYAKGANWIPADAFDRDSEEDWRWLLGSGKDANMNMVRVWGGGKFMSDAFYQECDRLGIMVWQEMMFGCALYPTDSAFLAQISSEVKDVVARLQRHPSIVIWGGNNENEGALTWYRESLVNRSFYQADYAKLYVDTVYAALAEADPELVLPAGHNVSHKNGGRTWVDSSPSNGLFTQDAHDKRWGSVGDWEYGDVHYYNYDADCEDFTTYPQARFVSEHGFQSWPAFTLLEPVTEEEDWSRESRWFGYRQRHQQGNKQLLNMMGKHLPVPPANASSTKPSQRSLFDSYLYLTQVQQARCYETAIGQWRRLKGDPLVQTMGVLYWQMNDIWQGPSWSSMEYDGRWRVVQYAVQRAYAPLLLSSYAQGKHVHVHLTSDAMQALEGLTLKVHLHEWMANTATPLHTMHFTNISLERLASKELAAFSLDVFPKYIDIHRMFLRLEVVDSAGAGVAECFHWLTTLGDAKLPPATQKIESVNVIGPSTAQITVSGSGTNLFVLLETSGGPSWAGKFSENAFTLLPGEFKTLSFTARSQVDFTEESLKAKLQVRSLADALVRGQSVESYI